MPLAAPVRKNVWELFIASLKKLRLKLSTGLWREPKNRSSRGLRCADSAMMELRISSGLLEHDVELS
jgi:hypothetical protein